MDDASKCQSCGLPVHAGNFGTNASGSMNFEYCNLCFQKGSFSDMDITVDMMIKMTAARLVQQFGKNEEEALREATEVIPRLKRWRSSF